MYGRGQGWPLTNLTGGGEGAIPGRGNSLLGGHLSEETKQKISKLTSGVLNHNYGKKFSEEHRRKISEGRKGWRYTEEHRRNMSRARKGRKLSEETKQKISKSNMGKVRTEEQNRRNSETSSGALNPNYGKVYTAEESAKMSRACMGNQNALGHQNSLGYKHTKEARQKMSKNMAGNKRAITKLTEEDVIEIRRLFTEGVSQRRLSELYPVCYTNIGKVVQRLTWRHI